MKIGVFDSGIGGLTVLSELRRRFPSESYYYLGDTAHLPYGSKSPAQIVLLAKDCARLLRDENVDVAIVACNTASAWAIDEIRDTMGDTPVFGVVKPSAQAAIRAYKEIERPSRSPILVLATRATVQSGAYGKILRENLQDPNLVIEQACPLLVPMIEEGWIEHPILRQTIREYVSGHFSRSSTGVALLGCTHYPWIQSAFEDAMPGWRVVNSASAICDALEQMGLVRSRYRAELGKGSLRFLFTDSDAVPNFARELVKSSIGTKKLRS